jgi:uncharacterized membrane protein (TIGR02234 family)
VSARRELLIAALLCAVGGALAVTAAGRPWAEVRISGAGTPLGQSLTGRELSGAAGALGLAGLAGLAALFAVRGRTRVAVGALLVVFGGGAAYASVTAIRRAHVLSAAADKSSLAGLASTGVHTGAWPWISMAGGVLLAAAGLFSVVRGARWPGMSARYEAPGASHSAGASAAPWAAQDRATPDRAAAGVESDPSRLWKSLDRGEDPTEGSQDRKG